jgi:hypothetical protein
VGSISDADLVAKRKIVLPAGNQTPVIHQASLLQTQSGSMIIIIVVKLIIIVTIIRGSL